MPDVQIPGASEGESAGKRAEGAAPDVVVPNGKPSGPMDSFSFDAKGKHPKLSLKVPKLPTLVPPDPASATKEIETPEPQEPASEKPIKPAHRKPESAEHVEPAPAAVKFPIPPPPSAPSSRPESEQPPLTIKTKQLRTTDSNLAIPREVVHEAAEDSLKKALSKVKYADSVEGAGERGQQDFFGLHKKVVIIAAAAMVLIALMMGAAVFLLAGGGKSVPKEVSARDLRSVPSAPTAPKKQEPPAAKPAEKPLAKSETKTPAPQEPPKEAPAAAQEKKEPAKESAKQVAAQEAPPAPKVEETKPVEPKEKSQSEIADDPLSATARSQALERIKNGEGEQAVLDFKDFLKGRSVGGALLALQLIPLAQMLPEQTFSQSCLTALKAEPDFAGQAAFYELRHRMLYAKEPPKSSEFDAVPKSDESNELLSIALIAEGDLDTPATLKPAGTAMAFWKAFIGWRTNNPSWRDAAGKALLPGTLPPGKATILKVWLGSVKLEDARTMADSMQAEDAALLRILLAETCKRQGNPIGAKVLYAKAAKCSPNLYRFLMKSFQGN